MAKSFSVIVTFCKNNGVVSFNDHHALPWRKFLLKSLETFSKDDHVTQNKKEIVLILRTGTHGLLKNLLPKNVKQVILSTNKNAREEYGIPENIPIYTCLHQALLNIPYGTELYVTGATLINAAVKHPYCKRIYSTYVMEDIKCANFIEPISLGDYFIQNSSCIKTMDNFKYVAVIHERYRFHIL
jgi:dihydrofolate reductase